MNNRSLLIPRHSVDNLQNTKKSQKTRNIKTSLGSCTLKAFILVEGFSVTFMKAEQSRLLNMMSNQESEDWIHNDVFLSKMKKFLSRYTTGNKEHTNIYKYINISKGK